MMNYETISEHEKRTGHAVVWIEGYGPQGWGKYQRCECDRAAIAQGEGEN